MTGANKGIGYAIVKKLCKEFSGTVILTGSFCDLCTVYCDSIFSFKYLNMLQTAAVWDFKLLVLKTLVWALGLALTSRQLNFLNHCRCYTIKPLISYHLKCEDLLVTSGGGCLQESNYRRSL